jgi:HMG (high mobility group) box protein
MLIFSGKTISKQEVTKRLGEQWRELSPETKASYPALGKRAGNKKRKLGDEIIPAVEAWKKNKKRLIDNVQTSVNPFTFLIFADWVAC